MRDSKVQEVEDQFTHNMFNDTNEEIENVIKTSNQEPPVLDKNEEPETTIQLSEAIARYSSGSQFYVVDKTDASFNQNDLWVLKPAGVEGRLDRSFITPSGLFEGMRISFIAKDFNIPSANVADFKIQIKSLNSNGSIGSAYTNVGSPLQVYDRFANENRTDSQTDVNVMQRWHPISKGDILKNQLVELMVAKDNVIGNQGAGFYLVHLNRDTTPTGSLKIHYHLGSADDLTLPGYLRIHGNSFDQNLYPRLYNMIGTTSLISLSYYGNIKDKAYNSNDNPISEGGSIATYSGRTGGNKYGHVHGTPDAFTSGLTSSTSYGVTNSSGSILQAISISDGGMNVQSGSTRIRFKTFDMSINFSSTFSISGSNRVNSYKYAYWIKT